MTRSQRRRTGVFPEPSPPAGPTAAGEACRRAGAPPAPRHQRCPAGTAGRRRDSHRDAGWPATTAARRRCRLGGGSARSSRDAQRDCGRGRGAGPASSGPPSAHRRSAVPAAAGRPPAAASGRRPRTAACAPSSARRARSAAAAGGRGRACRGRRDRRRDARGPGCRTRPTDEAPRASGRRTGRPGTGRRCRRARGNPVHGRSQAAPEKAATCRSPLRRTARRPTPGPLWPRRGEWRTMPTPAVDRPGVSRPPLLPPSSRSCLRVLLAPSSFQAPAKTWHEARRGPRRSSAPSPTVSSEDAVR